MPRQRGGYKETMGNIERWTAIIGAGVGGALIMVPPRGNDRLVPQDLSYGQQHEWSDGAG
jgi:hypothetical protein